MGNFILYYTNVLSKNLKEDIKVSLYNNREIWTSMLKLQSLSNFHDPIKLKLKYNMTEGKITPDRTEIIFLSYFVTSHVKVH